VNRIGTFIAMLVIAGSGIALGWIIGVGTVTCP